MSEEPNRLDIRYEGLADIVTELGARKKNRVVVSVRDSLQLYSPIHRKSLSSPGVNNLEYMYMPVDAVSPVHWKTEHFYEDGKYAGHLPADGPRSEYR